MLRIHLANRFETLIAGLQAQLAADRGGPFELDAVIVPSAAIGRAMTLSMADTHGIASNLQLDYLAHWLWQQMARVLPAIPPQSPFAPAPLAWRVYTAFGDADFTAGHPRLQRYLDGADPLMRQQLAQRVAGLFEPYSTYRPDLLAGWRHGRLTLDHPDEAWQAALWRRLCDELALDSTHPAQTFVAALRAGGPALAAQCGLPARVHLLALPTMAPLHIELLAQLGACMQIDVHVLNPCREYWFELVEPRRLARLRAGGRDQGHEVGHKLLAAWGRQTQAHLDTLIDRCGDAEIDDGGYVSAPGDSLLARLQNTVLDLQDPAPAGPPSATEDRSIELHVCHSLTRELEVLHDRLLGLFAEGPAGAPSLRPADVLVTVPDLDAAAPLIDAVFGSVGADRHVPYTITGRARSRANEPARTLLALLSLAASRVTATEAFGLLQQPLVARRFGLGGDDLAQIHGWLSDAGFRWGLDAAHRGQLGLPPEPRHTWADAMARLFLGHAVPGPVTQPFGALLPAGAAEGSSALPLGALWHFGRCLDTLHDTLRTPHTPARWRAITAAAVDDFLTVDARTDRPSADDLLELQATLHELVETMTQGGLGEALPLPVWQAALTQALDDPARGGVPTGRVSFAAMSSLRGLPFQVVAMLGLDDGVFPAVDRPAEFDLMAAHPRRGDRQRRHDERTLFLDLLLAARRVVHLSHSGRSVRDNSPRPPSVLVDELLDWLVASAGADRAQLVVEHPLQPFSMRAFEVGGDPRLRSHDATMAQALRASLLAPPVPTSVPASLPTSQPGTADDDDAVAEPLPAFFVKLPLPEPDADWRQPTLAQLVDCFQHPSRSLLRQRLGLGLWQDDQTLDDDEAFRLDGLTRHALATRLLPAVLAGGDTAALQRLARAGTEVPAGMLGALVLGGELTDLQGFAALLREATAVAPLPEYHTELPFEIDGQTWTLQVGWADLRPDGLLRWRVGNARAKDRIEAWLQHLALCAAAPPGVAQRTCWLFRDGSLKLRKPAEAMALLQPLMALYRRGLSEPLPLFPEAAWALVTDGIGTAHQVWHRSEFRAFAEGDDAYHRLAWRGRGDPLAGEFEALATAVYGPLVEHIDDRYIDDGGAPA